MTLSQGAYWSMEHSLSLSLSLYLSRRFDPTLDAHRPHFHAQPTRSWAYHFYEAS